MLYACNQVLSVTARLDIVPDKFRIRLRMQCRLRRHLSYIVLLLVCVWGLVSSGPVFARDFTPAPLACGTGHPVNVPYTNGPTSLRLEDIVSLVGQYCDTAGTYEAGSTTTDTLSCNVVLSTDGLVSASVGGHVLEFAALREAMVSYGNTGARPEAKNYFVNFASALRPVTGGQERITASFEIQLNRVVFASVERAFVGNGEAKILETMACGFHHRSEVDTMIGGTIKYASADNLPPSVVGTFWGSAPSKVNEQWTRVPCSATVTSSGYFSIRSPVLSGQEGVYASASGHIEGRVFDQIFVGDGGAAVYAPADGDHWHTQPFKESVTLGLSADLIPTGAGGTLNNDDTLNYPAACDFTLPPESLPDDCTDAWCVAAKGNVGKMACQAAVGNPINAANGNKFQTESDFVGVGSVNLRFVRFYNSHWSSAKGSMGARWRTNYDRMLSIDLNAKRVLVYREDGRVVVFNGNGNVWEHSPEARGDLRSVSLPTLPSAAWRVTHDTDEVEYYNSIGQLIQIATPGGNVQNIKYDLAGRLQKVVDVFGHELSFTYLNERIDSMRDPSGAVYKYYYDGAENLSIVDAPGVPTRTQRKYFYEDSRYLNALTGIQDENGDRFATWHYDAKGRAHSSEHGNGIDKFTISFGDDGSSTVTDPLLTDRTLAFTPVFGVLKYTGESQPAGAGCEAASRYALLDENGNAKSRTDFNGNLSTYGYDLSRNLETFRMEAVSTPQERTIRTRWHPQLAIVSATAEPRLITTYDLDDTGLVRSVTEQPTSDASGAAGFEAVKVGRPRKWTYTHIGPGLIESEDGPRTDIVDLARYTYDLTTGNLETYKNAVGHLTTFSNYDLLGRPGRIVTPDKVISDLTYFPRGWLASRSVVAQGKTLLTSYEYDQVGQLRKIVLPNKGFVKLSYDSAHRLIDVSDNLGNSIHYTLDLAGNRKKEEAKDPGGVLTRVVTREFDALNRIETQTGEAP